MTSNSPFRIWHSNDRSDPAQQKRWALAIYENFAELTLVEYRTNDPAPHPKTTTEQLSKHTAKLLRMLALLEDAASQDLTKIAYLIAADDQN